MRDFDRLKRWPRSGLVFFAIASFYLVLRVAASFLVHSIMDEGQDLLLTKGLFTDLPTFFSHTVFLDQARLPHLVSAPILYLWRGDPIFPLRMLFLSFHFLYLWFSYKLLVMVTKSRRAAFLYVFLLLTSCYMAGFSYFSGTTAGWLYLLFHILCIYHFWKGFIGQKSSGSFPGYILFAFLLGCCVASSLFGLVLLPAIFVFHIACAAEKKLSVRSVSPALLILWGLFFLCGILWMQYMPVKPSLKIALVLTQAFFYLCGLIYLHLKERSEKSGPRPVHPILFWAAIILTACCVALILSPTYLNLRNILEIPGAVGGPRALPLVENRRPYEALRICFMKFGLLSSLALAVPLVHVLRKMAGRLRGEFHFLILLVIVFHMVLIGSSSYLTAYYFLAVIPFCYLVFVKFWTDSQKGTDRMRLFALLLLVLVVADNQVRYFRWYPYAHWDGAQYGPQEIGTINRAAMVSYELYPAIMDYAKKLDIASDRPVTLLEGLPEKFQLAPAMYMAPIFIRGRPLKNDDGSVRRTGPDPDPDPDPDLVLLKEFEPLAPGIARRFRAYYTKIKTFGSKGVTLFSLWELRRDLFR